MNDQTSGGMNRLSALLAWWGMSGVGNGNTNERQLNSLQNSVSAVQKAYSDAAARHMDAILSTNDRLAQTAQGLLKTNRPAELLSAQTEIMTVVLEAASRHATAWAEFQLKVLDIYGRCFFE